MNAKELIWELAKQVHGEWRPKSATNRIWIERSVGEDEQFIHFHTIRTSLGFRFIGEITCNVAIGKVEEILRPLYKKYGIEYLNRTLQFTTKRQPGIEEIGINSIADLAAVLPWIVSAIDNEISNFFAANQNLELINKVIDSMEKGQISSFVHPPPILKIVTLKAILNTNDFRSYSSWAISTYNRMALGKPNGLEEKCLNILNEITTAFVNGDRKNE